MNSYTPQQILDEFRRRRYMEPLRTDCVIERTNGPDIDTMLMAEIRHWYARLIDTAPPAWLAVDDVANEVTQELIYGAGAVELTLPPDVRRVINLTIDGNPNPIIPITDPSLPLIALQSSPFTRGGRNHPVAVMTAPDRITLYAHDSNGYPPELCRLLAVRLNDDIFQFDNRAWETVPQITL